MTKIFLYVRGKDDIRGFLSAGHADWAQEGSDIVCAAVSALTQTCVNAIETFTGILPAVRINDGFLAAMLPKGWEDHDAQVLLHGLLQGLRDIEKQYPHHVRLYTRPVH